nr:RNA-directed DNA polymerase, eukaryota, reverse transcriptase zinc-binding domain protein [Tanacetum cinerariifolium]
MREVNKLKGKGFDFWSHCKKRIGNDDDSRFWFDCWIGDVPLRVKFPRLFALDLNKEASVAVKLSAPIDVSFRRNARGEASLLSRLIVRIVQSARKMFATSSSVVIWLSLFFVAYAD